MRRLNSIWKKNGFWLTVAFLFSVTFWFFQPSTSYHKPLSLIFSSLHNCVYTWGCSVQSIKTYLNLRQENERLRKENKQLIQSYLEAKQQQGSCVPSLTMPYQVVGAIVLYQTVHLTKNHLTINKGAREGIGVGMGVIAQEGIVGIIKKVFDHHAIVISLLNNELLVSTKVNGILSTLHWKGQDSQIATLMYVPHYETIKAGQEVFTSGYSQAFPGEIKVGTVKKINKRGVSGYQDISVLLSTPFHKLQYVYVIKKPIPLSSNE